MWGLIGVIGLPALFIWIAWRELRPRKRDEPEPRIPSDFEDWDAEFFQLTGKHVYVLLSPPTPMDHAFQQMIAGQQHQQQGYPTWDQLSGYQNQQSQLGALGGSMQGSGLGNLFGIFGGIKH